MTEVELEILLRLLQVTENRLKKSKSAPDPTTYCNRNANLKSRDKVGTLLITHPWGHGSQPP